MTMFEKIKSMTIEEFSEWLNEHGTHDYFPWIKWWDRTYCNKCEPEFSDIFIEGKMQECCWCELNNKCRFFQDMDEIPSLEQIVKMWLELEDDDYDE